MARRTTRRCKAPLLQVEKLPDGRYRLLAYGLNGKIITEQELRERAKSMQIVVTVYEPPGSPRTH